MTDDTANPFRKLAKEFADRKATGKASSSIPAQPVTRYGRRAKTPEENGDDGSALFLDAVRRIRPLPGGKHERDRGGISQGSLADAFAASLRDNQAPHRTKTEGDRSVTVSEDFTAPPESLTPEPAEPSGLQGGFSTAMRELFYDGPVPEQSGEEEALFSKAMKGVVPVNGRGRDVAVPAGGGKKLPVHDPAQALRDVLEGRVEFALYHTDEYMEGYVTGVDPLVLARLRSGQYSPEKHLDLHGMNSRQAHDALVWFFRDAYQRGMRTVVVVTGRGRNSPDGVGVLRPLLQRWLCREPFKRVVLAFCTAKPGDGGPGAVYVLLRKYKKSRGKIIWEHTPSDDDFPDI